MNYQPYTHPEIRQLLYEPWEISDRPYMLHAAYALSCLYEAVAPIDYDEEPGEDDARNTIWGAKIPKKILDRLVTDIAGAFNEAAVNHRPIDIWGKAYSIRKVNAYDRKRLNLIFNFPLNKDEYTVVPEGIMNLYGTIPEPLQKYELSKEEAQANRTYLRQIIMLAEDDKNNGWDKLTDMEVALYCWALFYNKKQNENIIEFRQMYKDYLYVNQTELEKCYTDKAALRQKPCGLYTFSVKKVTEWNTANKQKSHAAAISPQAADDYWYNKALQSTFKPNLAD